MAESNSASENHERLKGIADRLRREYGAQRVLLFGSAARGDATEESDIDLLVVATGVDL